MVSGVELVTTSYTTETSKETVVVAYTDHPRTMKFSDPLDGAAKGSAKNVDGVILSRTATTFMGHPAMDVVVKAPIGMINERLVMRDHRLYMVMAISPAGHPRPTTTCCRRSS